MRASPDLAVLFRSDLAWGARRWRGIRLDSDAPELKLCLSCAAIDQITELPRSPMRYWSLCPGRHRLSSAYEASSIHTLDRGLQNSIELGNMLTAAHHNGTDFSACVARHVF